MSVLSNILYNPHFAQHFIIAWTAAVHPQESSSVPNDRHKERGTVHKEKTKKRFPQAIEVTLGNLESFPCILRDRMSKEFSGRPYPTSPIDFQCTFCIVSQKPGIFHYT